ncbi:MAG: response regulator [Bryobacteraceae bacterium]|jgi:two-component system chemotaxis response regulator CheY
MIDLEDELAKEYLAESREHLATMEMCLLSIEKGGPAIDEELVNRAFRAVHSIKGGAGVFDLVNISDLAHQTENVLVLIRSREMVPTPERVRALLFAADRLLELIENPGLSNQADISEVMAALANLLADPRASAAKDSASSVGRAAKGGRNLRALLVEDDFASRLLLQTFLSRYGECHIAVNGREAVEAVRSALERGERYDLICMDIMMPEMDGREAVRRARALEVEHGILSSSGAKIIMTTAVEDMKEVIRCFQELCDAYLMKPIDLAQLLSHMRSYQLVQ